MTTEKMTVHKALCELKTLESRITKGIEENVYVFANKHSNIKVGGVPVSTYCDEIKAKYESIASLIRRRDALKRAVVLSNASTRVSVGGKEYTVAEAIEMKNNGIPLLRVLRNKLDKDNRFARREANENNGDYLERRADEYIKSLYGNTDMKNASDEIKKVRADFIASQTFEIVDPIGVKGKMERLDSEINGFMVDIDAALSVSNALTEISIEY